MKRTSTTPACATVPDGRHAPERPALRILYVIPTMGFGGAEALLASQIPFFLHAGVEPIILTVHDDKGLLDARGLAVQYETLDLPRPNGTLRSVLLGRGIIGGLRAAIRRLRPDAVHLNLMALNCWGRLATRGVVPTVTSWHNTDPWMTARRLTSRVKLHLERYTCTAPDNAYIAVSRSVQEWCCRHLRVPPERAEVIYNGIDLSSFPTEPARRDHHPPRVVMVARFHPAKAHDVALRALRRVRDAGVAFAADLYGEGPLFEQTRALAYRLQLDDCVQFRGVCRTIPQVLPDYDVFLMPSRHEGLPISAMEAMACFVPIVGTRCSGLTEVVEHERTGLLADIEDVEGVANALTHLLGDAELRAKFARAARPKVETEFNLAMQVPRIVACYNRLLNRRADQHHLQLRTDARACPLSLPEDQVRRRHIRICFLSEGDVHGGCLTSLRRLVSILDPEEFQVHLAWTGPGPAQRILDDLGHPTVTLDIGSAPLICKLIDGRKVPDWSAPLWWARTPLVYAQRLARICRDWDIDIIYTNQHFTHLLGGTAARLIGAKSIWHVRGLISHTTMGGIPVQAFSVAAACLASRIICVARSVAARFPRIARHKLCVVYNPGPDGPPPSAEQIAAYRREFGAGPDGIVFGMVTRLNPNKGVSLFLDAARRMRTSHPNVKFVIAGRPENPAEAALLREHLAFCERHGLNDTVRFLGFRTDAKQLYYAFDAACMCTLYTEACPNAVLEAMAAGVPSVVSNVGGQPELVLHRCTGLVYPPRNLDAFLAALNALATEPALRARYGQVARQRFLDHFQVRDHARRIAQICREVGGNTRGRRGRYQRSPRTESPGRAVGRLGRTDLGPF